MELEDVVPGFVNLDRVDRGVLFVTVNRLGHIVSILLKKAEMNLRKVPAKVLVGHEEDPIIAQLSVSVKDILVC